MRADSRQVFSIMAISLVEDMYFCLTKLNTPWQKTDSRTLRIAEPIIAALSKRYSAIASITFWKKK